MTSRAYLKKRNVSLEQNESSVRISTASAAQYKPAYHFSPSRNWLSDPNGMVYGGGCYHLCYQHDRYDAIFKRMSWGHAVSKDLVHWQELAPVVEPDEQLGMCFSGCMVVDADNTTGFGAGALIGFYTSELPKQQQSMIISTDGGKTFEKYAHNPVIESTETMSPDFRDPKVFWCQPAGRWMMSVAGPERVEFWSSNNLIDWQFESQFGDGHGVHGVEWECPDLRRMPVGDDQQSTRWVLLVSVNPGAPNGGSGAMYFVGDFHQDDGTWRFVSEHTQPRWLDWGCDNYAHVSWADSEEDPLRGRILSIGWMNNWNYATTLPTAPWRGSMTMIRELKLKPFPEGLVLTARPAEIYKTLQGELLNSTPIGINQPTDIGPSLATSYIDATFDGIETTEYGFEITNHRGDMVRVGFVPDTGFFVDRTGASGDFNDAFSGVHFANTTQQYRSGRFEIYLDRCSVEVFFNDGEFAITELIFPDQPLTTVTPYAVNPLAQVDARITKMRNIKISAR